MHIHTSPCSGGGSPIEDHILALKEKGYAGMVVTNHFINGDHRIDPSLPWEDFVAAYKEDYERGLAFAKEHDFDVIFGLEEQVGYGKEILIYGVTPELFAAHPELKCASADKYAEVVHAAGGLVYQAHPYRDRYYIADPGPVDCPSLLDGIEVYNAANEPAWNEKASALAEKLSLSVIAGSDGHSTASAGKAGIITKERIRTGEDLVRILKSGNYELYKG